ncbi:MAG: pyridoxamine 5'-phosphate oxidase family protein [Patescibacteria group bacterium]
MLSPALKACLESASAKALASNGKAGLNVVPVSMLKVNDDSLWLFDFFMDKTALNIKENPEVALTCWNTMIGAQMKGTVTYVESGDVLAAGVAFVKEQNPARVVKAVLVFTPTAIFDISPGGAFTPEELAIG